MIQIIRYNADSKIQWDSFIREESKNGLFFFERDFMDYHSDRFIDHSLIISKDGKVLALFPANESDNIIYSHQGLTYGSLIVSAKIKAKDVLEIFKAIKDYYIQLSFNKIIYKSIPHIFHHYPSEEDLYAIFRLNGVLIRRDISSVIDLSNPIRFSETKRQITKKCKENGVLIIENEHFDNYWKLLCEVLKKFNTNPVHTVAEISSLRDKFPKRIRLFEAVKDEVLLAGIMIFDFGNVVHTQYMATSQAGRKIGALDFINHFLITTEFKNKKYYSFGISTEDQGMILNEGLINQKEMYGGRGIVLDHYQISL